MTREEAILHIERIKLFLTSPKICWSKDDNKIVALDMAIEALAERPKGEWVKDECKDGEQWYRCSNCGERYVLIETSGRSLDVGFPFCPHYTADMRGEEE